LGKWFKACVDQQVDVDEGVARPTKEIADNHFVDEQPARRDQGRPNTAHLYVNQPSALLDEPYISRDRRKAGFSFVKGASGRLTTGRFSRTIRAGRDTFLKSPEVLRPHGVLVAFGQALGSPPAFDPFLLAPKALHVSWPGRHICTASRRRLETSAF
jgi:hypothetical protein